MLSEKIIFTGFMDQDSSDRYLQPGDYRSSLNVRIVGTEGEYENEAENIRGNVYVEYDLPLGENKVIGYYENKQEGTGIYAVYNSLGDHSILRYHPSRGTYGEVENIIESDQLFFSGKLITGIAMVEDLFSWAVDDNEPRKINITKASREKQDIYEIYFSDATDGATLREITISATGISGTITLTNLSSKTEQAKQFTQLFNSNPSYPWTAKQCGDFVEVTSDNEGATTFTATARDIITLGSVSVPIHVQLINRYYAIQDELLDLAKPSLPCAPEVSYGFDGDFRQNLIQERTWQFATGLLYDDNEKSVLSPYSTLPLDGSGCLADDSNYIEIDFSYPWLSDPARLSIIRGVIIYAREGNTGPWKEVTTLNRNEFVLDQRYRFYNNGQYDVLSLAPLDYRLNVDVSPPRRADALEVVSDQENNRLFIGDTITDFDPVCTDVGFSTSYSLFTSQATSDIKGILRIANDLINVPGSPEYNINQAVHDYGSGACYGGFSATGFNNNVHDRYRQALGSDGFVIYLAGTTFYGVSVQRVFTTSAGAQPTLTSSDKNVFDSSKTGNPLFGGPSQNTYRAAIRDGIEEVLILSDWEIKGVPPGEYILRVAHPGVGVNDPLGRGDYYDLSNPDLLWQKTSAPVASIAGIPYAEIPVSVTGNGLDVNVGEIVIKDLTTAGKVNFAVHGYCYDQEGNNTPSVLDDGGIPMSMQQVWLLELSAANVIVSSHSTYTDHNGGFFFGIRYGSPTNKYRLAAISTSGQNNVSGIVTGQTLNNILVTNHRVLNDYQDSFQNGDLGGVLSSSIENPTNNQADALVLPNTDSVNTDIFQTRITGRLNNSNGTGIRGALVVYTRAQWTRTDSSGNFSIVVHPDVQVNNNDREGQLYFSSGTCQIEVPGQPVSADIEFYNQGANYSRDFPLNLVGITANILAGNITRVFKRGSSTDIGLIYKDRNGRPTVVNPSGEIYIPFWTEEVNGAVVDGTPVVSWEINHSVPQPKTGYFTHYQWVRTRMDITNVLQYPAGQVRYVVEWDGPTIGSYTGSNTREIGITLDLDEFENYNTGSQLAYQFTPGDRLRLIRREDGTLLGELYDTEVVGLRGDEVVIRFDSSWPEIKTGFLVEIYFPFRDSEDKLYYEFGPCYEITDPQGNPVHSVTNGVFNTGDAYVRERAMQYRPSALKPVGTLVQQIESESVSDFYTSNSSDLGRIHVENPNTLEKRRPSFVQFSNSFFPGTRINGLSVFEPNNGRQFSLDFGAVEKLITLGENLVAIFNNATVNIYIGRALLESLNQASLVSVTDQVIGGETTYQKEYGTWNPESVAKHGGYIFWWDETNGIVARLASNGIFEISKLKMSSFFHETGKKLRRIHREKGSPVEVVGVYNERYDDYVLTFEENISDKPATTKKDLNGLNFDPFTIHYHNGVESRSGWVGFLSYLPEYYGKIGNQILSFNNGLLWLHDQNESYNQFYNTDYPSRVEVVSRGDDFSERKTWKALEVVCSSEVTAPIVSVYEAGRREQLSRIPKFRRRERDWYAPFKRDLNTPGKTHPLTEGKLLRGHTARITIEFNGPERQVLSEVTVSTNKSERSNK